MKLSTYMIQNKTVRHGCADEITTKAAQMATLRIRLENNTTEVRRLDNIIVVKEN
jgi:hypothetical protein